LIGQDAIEKAVEEFVIGEMKRIMVKHMNQIIEDSLVEIMQRCVIRIYRSDKLKGVQFEIELKDKTLCS